MPLTDTAIKNAKPKDKPYKLADEKGLYVLVKQAGKYFRFDYRFAGKRKTLAIGVYPEVSLKEAREKRDEARKLLRNGIDPSETKKAKKLQCVTMNALEARLTNELAGTKTDSFIFQLHENGYFDAAELQQLLQDCRALAEVYQAHGKTPHYAEMTRLILDRLAYAAALIYCHYAASDRFRIINWNPELENEIIPNFFTAMRAISSALIL